MGDIVSLTQWEISRLVKDRIFPDEQSVLRSAIRSLFEARPELKRKIVLSAYREGEISLGKASELMGVCQEEMKEIIVESGGEIYMGPETLEEIRQDIANA